MQKRAIEIQSSSPRASALGSHSASRRPPGGSARSAERTRARPYGNRALSQLLAAGVIQAKLEVNRPGDRWEQEADQVADRVVAGGAASPPAVQRLCKGCEEEDEQAGVLPTVQRRCRECEEETVQAKEQPGRRPGRGARWEPGLRSLQGRGEPLPPVTRSFFEGRFGRDFGGVRIHRDARAAETAAALDARAFTVGRDIAFAPGEFSPGTRSGRHLLAHELTHVVQQGNGNSPTIQRFSAAECTASSCSPASRCDTVQADFERAEQYVERSVTALEASPLATFTQRAIQWYFHRAADTRGGDIRRRLDLIDLMLLTTDVNAEFQCRTGGTCDDAIAYVNTSTPVDTPHYTTIKLCNSYFRESAKGRAEALIHESAHLIGMSVSTDDVYDHGFRFRGLSTDQAILNCDSYALFASAIGTGSIGLSAVLSAGVGGGALFGGPAGVGWAASFFVDTTFQHPVLHVFNPALRLSVTLVGVPESGARPTPDQATFFATLAGFRVGDPRPSGGTPTLSVFAGPSFNLRGGETAVGAQVTVAAGYQWSFLDLSAGWTFIHDPTALPGARNLHQLGATVTLILPAINP